MIKVSVKADKPIQVKSIMDNKGVHTLILTSVANEIRQRWINAASRDLNSTLTEYVSAIGGVKIKGTEATIELSGALPNALEMGSGPFDMKDPQWEKDIPMGHGSVGKEGSRSVPTDAPLLNRGLTDAMSIGRKVFMVARQLKPGQQLPGGLAPKLKDKHKGDIFEGMAKKRMKGSKSMEYKSFRRMSPDQSGAWIHPGFRARNFAEEAMDNLDSVVDKAITSFIDEAIK